MIFVSNPYTNKRAVFFTLSYHESLTCRREIPKMLNMIIECSRQLLAIWRYNLSAERNQCCQPSNHLSVPVLDYVKQAILHIEMSIMLIVFFRLTGRHDSWFNECVVWICSKLLPMLSTQCSCPCLLNAPGTMAVTCDKGTKVTVYVS